MRRHARQGPRGREGPQGPNGLDGATGATGATGDVGVTPALSIGTVTSVGPTGPPTVTISGTIEAPVLSFGLQQGATGATGAAGATALRAGASNTGTSNGVRFLWPDVSQTAVTASYQPGLVAQAFTVTSVELAISSAGGGTGNITYTLYKNNVATAISVVVPATQAATTGAPVTATGFSVAFGPGNTYAWAVKCSGTVTAGHGSPVIQARG